MANEGRDPSLPALPVCVCRHPYCRLWRRSIKVAKGMMRYQVLKATPRCERSMGKLAGLEEFKGFPWVLTLIGVGVLNRLSKAGWRGARVDGGGGREPG